MKQHILIVEDSLPAMMVEKMLVKSLGYEVDGAETGNKALELATKNHDQYGLILLDIGLPDLNGDQVCEKIRAYEKASNTTHIPIVAVTGNNDPTEHKLCLDAGMDEIVVKPLSKEKAAELLTKYHVA